MTTKEAAAALVLGAIAAAAIGVSLNNRPMPLEKAIASGFDPMVLRRNGQLVAFRDELDGGRNEVVVDHSPCAKATKGDCHSTVKGIPTVSGNVMQAGAWAGTDCIEVPCSVMAGEEAP